VAVSRGAIVRYAILGPIGLCDGARLLPIGGPRQVALLALLLVHANRALSSDRLIDAFWGQQDPAGALKSLHVAISRLRKALDIAGAGAEPALRTVAGGYLLAVQPGELDSEVFQTCLRAGRRALEAGDAARARAVLDEALGMWRGPALAEVAYEEFAQSEVRRLEELRLAAVEARVDAGLQLGEHAVVIAELESLVAQHPGRERLVAQLMLALYRCGRQGEALDVFARTRGYLSRELGLEPGPALKTVQAEILAQAPALRHVGHEPGPAAGDALAAAPAQVTVGPVRLPLPRSLRIPASSPFVGRDEELARLRDRWAQVRAGARPAVVMAGEAGIGKTRLASEFATAVNEEGALVLYGRCDEGLAVPYQPFVEALRPYIRAVGLDRLRSELGELAPELGRLLPELTALGEPLRADPESERFALFEAVAALIETASRKQRMLLLLDDLQWAANPTLLLLRHLIRSERHLNVLLLGTYRHTELDAGDQLAEILADLHRDASVDVVSIRGLDEKAIAALLMASSNGDCDRADELAHLLWTETAGNPFFVRELLAHLVESGAISHGREHSSSATAAHLEVPEGLRQVIGHRVARLSASSGRSLAVAAVAGATFSLALLERVLGGRTGVLEALEEAVAAGLLTEAGQSDYVFAHALVRQTIYAQLGAARRMRVHRQIGEALETLGETDGHVEALAYHFAQAATDGQGVKAADYALDAGRSATNRLGYEEAAAHFERGLRALNVTGHPQDERRCKLLLALGEARWGEGKLDDARQAYGQAAKLAEQLGDTIALARAALGACGPHRHEITAAVTGPVADLLQRALTALGGEDSPVRAQVMGRLAAYTDDEDRRPLLAREALAMARRVADNATLADVLASTHRATHGPDVLHESLAMAEELRRVAHVVGDAQLRALAYRRLARVLLELGDIEAVERELKALQQLADTRREGYFKWLFAALQANHAHLEGRLEDCETLAREALAHRFEGHDEAAAQTFGVQMFLVRREQGRLDELVEVIEGNAARYPRLRSWRYAVACVYAQLGRWAETRQEFEALAHADFRDLPRDGLWLWSLFELSDVVLFLGDVPRAQLLYKLLLPYGDRCAVSITGLCEGAVSRPLGRLATKLSQYENAERHFKQALKMNSQIRSPLWIAHTQHDYGHMLLLRNCAGDRDDALGLLTAALAAAEKLRLKALADKTRALMVPSAA
jgi:DNA-binding SARP family transcriptional activator